MGKLFTKYENSKFLYDAKSHKGIFYMRTFKNYNHTLNSSLFLYYERVFILEDFHAHQKVGALTFQKN